MAEKSAQEKLLYTDVLRYWTERSYMYREEAEKQWKRTIRRKAQVTVNDGKSYIKEKNGQ